MVESIAMLHRGTNHSASFISAIVLPAGDAGNLPKREMKKRAFGRSRLTDRPVLVSA